MYGYIYITVNLDNGYRYIGQHRGLEFDPNYHGSGTALLRAIKKHGAEAFVTTMIEACENQDELNLREKYWIKFYDAVKDRSFYNLVEGGNGGNFWENLTLEQQNRFREIIACSNKNRTRDSSRVRGNKNPVYGAKWYNDGYRNYLLAPQEGERRKLNLGMIRSVEHNKKIAQALTGKKHTWNSTGNRKCINDGYQNKFVKPDELDLWLSKGWVIGMVK